MSDRLRVQVLPRLPYDKDDDEGQDADDEDSANDDGNDPGEEQWRSRPQVSQLRLGARQPPHSLRARVPPGVEPRSAFQLRPALRPTTSRRVKVHELLKFTLAHDLLLAMYGPLPIPEKGGNIEYMANIASVHCTSHEKFYIYFRLAREGTNRPRVRFEWATTGVGKNRQRDTYEIHERRKDAHRQALNPVAGNGTGERRGRNVASCEA